MTTAVAPSAFEAADTEAREEFECFGGSCTVLVAGPGLTGSAWAAADRAHTRLRSWHGEFSRFDRFSELSRLNADRRETVPVTAMMIRFVEAALDAARLTGGLVDPTLVTEIEQAGYTDDLGPDYAATDAIARLRPERRPAGPDLHAHWKQITVNRRDRVVTRPAGVRLDSGGVAKGLFGDVLAALLSLHSSFVIAAAGDVRLGGKAGKRRAVEVKSPFKQGSVLDTFELSRGAVATSGTTKRRWVDGHGRLSHHLLDPATGRPAYTGVVQATALAPTGVQAEARAKAAVLSGPEQAARWLPDGGVIAYDDGTYDVLEASDRAVR